MGCIEMDNGAIDESEGSDPDEDDGESNNLTFYYDPSLDGPQNVSPDRDVAANTLRSSTIGLLESLIPPTSYQGLAAFLKMRQSLRQQIPPNVTNQRWQLLVKNR